MLNPIINFVANLNVGSDNLKDFIDRVSSGKKIIKYENGTTETVTIENAEDAIVEGTPINRENLMAIQGFIGNVISVDNNGNIIQTNSKNETKIITPLINGARKTIFEGAKIMTIKTSFDTNGILEKLL